MNILNEKNKKSKIKFWREVGCFLFFCLVKKGGGGGGGIGAAALCGGI
jgi:hypothetical protein